MSEPRIDWERITLEVAKGQTVNNADTPDEAAFRVKVAADVARIKEIGGMIDIPIDLMGSD